MRAVPLLVSRDDDHRVVNVPLQGARDRAEDMVVSVLGLADDEDHRDARPVLAAQFVCHGDQLVRDRAAAALEVPVLRGAEARCGWAWLGDCGRWQPVKAPSWATPLSRESAGMQLSGGGCRATAAAPGTLVRRNGSRC